MERMDNVTQQKRRIPEMDVMKGILGILVIMGHILYIEGYVGDVQPAGQATFFLSTIIAVGIAPYYMAAFFFVTGYCSSFKSDIKTQIISDAKHLLLPVILIPAIMSAVLLLFGIPWSFAPWFLWFLWSLFSAKIIYKLVSNYVRSEILAWIILAVLSLIGEILLYRPPITNYCGYQQALVFPIFIALGRKVRTSGIKTATGLISIAIYVIAVIISNYILHWGAPAICSFTTFSPTKWPVFIILASSGTIAIFYLSRYLRKSKILEYIGRQMLVLYLVHIAFLQLLTVTLRPIIEQHSSDNWFQSLYFILATLGAILWSMLWAELFDRRIFRWILGKF